MSHTAAADFQPFSAGTAAFGTGHLLSDIN